MAQPPINPKVLAALKAIQDGKRKPIVVTNPNDPRLKAYQDSLATYERNVVDPYTLSTKKLIPLPKRIDQSWADRGIMPILWRGTTHEGTPFFKNPEQPVVLQTPPLKPVDTIGKNVPLVQNGKTIGMWNERLGGTPMANKQAVVTPKPVVVQRTPVVIPAKIPIKLAPTNFVAPLPATPAPQPITVTPPSQPIQPAPPNKPDSLWGPGQRYSLKDEKVRRMLKAIQSLKRQ